MQAIFLSYVSSVEWVRDTSSRELLGLLGIESIGSSVHDGFNLHSVGWISDENWQFFSHADLGQSELTVEVAPELGLERFSGELGQWDGVHTDSGHNLIGGQELVSISKVVSEASLSHDVWSNVEGFLSTQEFDGGV